jgi:hypothetical protein
VRLLQSTTLFRSPIPQVLLNLGQPFVTRSKLLLRQFLLLSERPPRPSRSTPPGLVPTPQPFVTRSKSLPRQFLLLSERPPRPSRSTPPGLVPTPQLMLKASPALVLLSKGPLAVFPLPLQALALSLLMTSKFVPAVVGLSFAPFLLLFVRAARFASTTRTTPRSPILPLPSARAG